jgi:hypothetical protein
MTSLEATAARAEVPGQLNLGFERVCDGALLDTSAVPWVDLEPKRRRTVMFPTVVDMRGAGTRADTGGESGEPRSAGTKAPIDAFYMYYAPHRSAGIGLATAPGPEGPWTPYHDNPIVRLEDYPGISDHISSPELVRWPQDKECPYRLYVHGRTGPRAEGFGQHTCLAKSADGVSWQPVSGEPVLTATPEQSGHTNSAAYARMFRRGGWLYALYKSEHTHGLARSQDGVTWEHWLHNPVIGPDEDAGDPFMIRHTGLLVRGDRLLIFYSCNTGPGEQDHGGGKVEKIKLATFDVGADDWWDWGGLRRRGVVFSPEREWEAGDARDPFLLVQGETLYLYYVGGHEQGVGLAKTPTAALEAAGL